MSVLTGLTVFSRTREVVKKNIFTLTSALFLNVSPITECGIYVSAENVNKFGIEIAQ